MLFSRPVKFFIEILTPNLLSPVFLHIFSFTIKGFHFEKHPFPLQIQ